MLTFVDKLIAELDNGNCTEAILNSNGATDAPCFQKVFAHADAICFIAGRLLPRSGKRQAVRFAGVRRSLQLLRKATQEV